MRLNITCKDKKKDLMEQFLAQEFDCYKEIWANVYSSDQKLSFQSLELIKMIFGARQYLIDLLGAIKTDRLKLGGTGRIVSTNLRSGGASSLAQTIIDIDAKILDILLWGESASKNEKSQLTKLKISRTDTWI